MPDLDAPRIGDFSRSVVDAPKKTAPGASPTKDALEAVETRLDAEASKDEETLKPLASFEEKLKAAGIDRTKAAEIIDAVLMKGFYAENIKITSTVSARFRTRSARDIRRTNEMLESQRFTMDAHYAEAYGRLLLAASLEAFAKDKFTFPNTRSDSADAVEKAFLERVAYIDGLSDPALRILLQKMWKFDNKVSVVLEEGSIENF